MAVLFVSCGFAFGQQLTHLTFDNSLNAEVGENGIAVGDISFVEDRFGRPNAAVSISNPIGTTSISPKRQHVNLANGGGAAGLNTGTMSLWVKWNGSQNAGSDGGYGFITGRQKDGRYSNQMLGLSNPNPEEAVLLWRPYAHFTRNQILGTTVIGPEWRHVAVTWESGSHKLYLDGQLEAAAALTGSMQSEVATPFSIGAWPDSGESYSNVVIDDFKLFDGVLSNQEIEKIARGGFSVQIIEGNFTWQEAKADAEAKGGRLAVLDTQEKIDAANTYLEELGEWPDLMIGLTDQDQEGQWQWITDDILTADNWWDGEPNGGTSSNYVQLLRSNNVARLRWNDITEEDAHSYLLEILDRPPAPPVIKLDSFYESNPQEEIVLDATPTEGFPDTFTYQWSFNDQPIPAFLGGAQPTFSLLGDQSQDGTWKVVVSNTVGTTEASFEYRVFVDNDSDGLSNYREENFTLTNPDLADSDSDGLSDPDELSIHGTDPNVADVDEDGLNDSEEIAATTDPSVADTDNDGLLDGAEVKTYASNPKSGDTDNDGIADAAEVAAGLDINTAESIADAVAFLTQELANRPTLEEVKDGRLGSVLLLPDAQTNIVRLRFCIEESDELGQWITREEEAEVEIPLDPNKKFFRVSVKEDE